MLDPRRLRVLAEVERRGSITAAAQALSFVPSAISQQISALERELGIQLTERVGRRTTLTPAGRVLAEHSEQILLQLAQAEEAVRQLDGQAANRLRLAASPDASAAWLAGALEAMSTDQPDCALTLMQRPGGEAISAVRRHEADLAVVCRAERNAAEQAGLVERVLLCDRLMLVVAAAHPASLTRRVELSSLAGEPWVLPSPGSLAHALTLAACRSAGFEPSGAYRTDDAALALELVAAGLGVAVLPSGAVDGLSETVAARPIRDAPVRLTIALWREDDRSGAVAAMLECLAAQAIGSDQ